MKKLLASLLLIPLMVLVVSAAEVPYRWSVGGEYLDSNSPHNYAQTATQTKDGKTVTLTLENYNGGKLILDCYGTGQEGMKFVIVLKGENTIKADDIGIEYNYSTPIEFTGTGKLTINAPKPESYSDAKDTKVIDLSAKEEVVEEESNEYQVDTPTVPEKEDPVVKQDRDNNRLSFVAGLATGFVAVIVASMVIRAMMEPKKDKKNKE